ncbi:H/ACA ribonucleoprotein complex subunit 2-like protein [Habropoda laboriosa]|uniref:H/ACA ribonucleoprotein complex subunit 2 n=1 Tax=Habropoda laboriosa TaxID=597456 RepID=A0A0L7RJK3_9HYME|nr:PREDICTED: H/ACA ribonucleoprotein complex subunit 2-like protein [Habropoda laboriosa]KOC70978.1 H/ACA ribonucleoprotein complex subunit 2-like protein [Habropoda laboriosa]
MGEGPIRMVIDESIKETEGDVPEISYEEKLKYTNPIAKPMAPKKLTKKIYKCIKKASKQKTFLRNGLKDVQKHLRKGEVGLVVFAGDVFPIEIMCHLPIVCEDKSIPYCYTPSRQDIGNAMGVKRGSLMVLIKEHSEYKDLFEEIKSSMLNLSTPL